MKKSLGLCQGVLFLEFTRVGNDSFFFHRASYIFCFYVYMNYIYLLFYLFIYISARALYKEANRL